MVVICVADVALPDIGPVNDAAVMLPVLVKMLVDGTYDIDVACVFSEVAVPPFAVFVNRMRCVVADPVLLIVTPPVPAGPRGTTSDRIGASGSVTSIVAEHVGKSAAVTVPIEITGVTPVLPVAPCMPGMPCAPCGPVGMPNEKIRAELVPLCVTVAALPDGSVDVIPTSNVAAAPGTPASPLTPGAPGTPVSPRGMLKSRIRADDGPEDVTLALVPAAVVVVEPTVIVAAAPAGPGSPCAPVSPGGPVFPRGISKLKICADVVPTAVTLALVPAAVVVVVPTVIVAASPAGPGSPWAPVAPGGPASPGGPSGPGAPLVIMDTSRLLLLVNSAPPPETYATENVTYSPGVATGDSTSVKV